MSIKFNNKTASLIDFVGVEEAEGLLEWVQSHPRGRIDLSECKHLNAANLQVLMATGATISSWPIDADLADWLRKILK